MMRGPTAVDAFCGAGGLSVGLARAGFDVVLAFDANVHAVATYRRNFSHPVLAADVRYLRGEDLLAKAGVERVTLLAGGPPCQGFSVQRRGEDHDSRNDLVLEFLRLIREMKPRFFLMENVPGLRNRRGRGHLRSFLAEAGALGYVCHATILNAADFGVPQIRKRLFVAGELSSEQQDVGFQFPGPAVASDAYVTVGHALNGLPSPPSDHAPHPEVPNHQLARMSTLNIRRISHVPQGGGWEHLPEELKLDCHRPGTAQIGHRYVYGRLHPDEPAGTITAKFDSFTRGKFAHPHEDRSITLREGARLQCFPDDFVFEGPKEEIAAQIGNAIPPPVAEALGRAFLAAAGTIPRVRAESSPVQMALRV